MSIAPTSSKNWIPNVNPAISKLSHAGFGSRDVEEVWKHIFIPRGHLKTHWVELHQHIDACKHISFVASTYDLLASKHRREVFQFQQMPPKPRSRCPGLEHPVKIFVEEDFQIMFGKLRQQSPLSISLPWHGISEMAYVSREFVQLCVPVGAKDRLPLVDEVVCMGHTMLGREGWRS